LPQTLTVAYRSLGLGQPLRPYLILTVTGLDGRVQNLYGLVDTGADTSSFPLAFAANLGYDTSTLSAPQTCGHAGGAGVQYTALRPCSAFVPELPDKTFDLNLSFIDGGQYYLWGRLDFMAAFDVSISQANQHFSITPVS
jgi:hypothetical protein